MITKQDHAFMAQAIRLAAKGRYTTDPNPRVGALVVRNGRIVGQGYHERAGQPHAEPIALMQAGADSKDSTVYVSLEPCSHFGRTPPCANALIEAGVKRVVVAMQDPNPRVAGAGLQRLKDAGIEVVSGVMQEAAEKLNPGFIKRMRSNRPLVRVKMGMSLDGRTAMASGESQWITAAQARRDVQFWRARSSAILTGIGTVLADDPSMNVRLNKQDLFGKDSELEIRQPIRVIADTRLKTPVSAKLLSLPGQTWIYHASSNPAKQAELTKVGAKLIEVECTGRHIPPVGKIGAGGDFENSKSLNLHNLLENLAHREINEVWVEAGSTLAGALLEEGLVDQLVLYIAPSLLGSDARGLFKLPGLQRLADRIKLQLDDVRLLGQDMRLIASVFPGSG